MGVHDELYEEYAALMSQPGVENEGHIFKIYTTVSMHIPKLS